MVKHNY
jgi:large subunit ribosomal protein L13e